jgi:hypothetical protein
MTKTPVEFASIASKMSALTWEGFKGKAFVLEVNGEKVYAVQTRGAGAGIYTWKDGEAPVAHGNGTLVARYLALVGTRLILASLGETELLGRKE